MVYGDRLLVAKIFDLAKLRDLKLGAKPGRPKKHVFPVNFRIIVQWFEGTADEGMDQELVHAPGDRFNTLTTEGKRELVRHSLAMISDLAFEDTIIRNELQVALSKCYKEEP